MVSCHWGSQFCSKCQIGIFFRFHRVFGCPRPRLAISRWPVATQRFCLRWEGQGTKGMAGERVVGAETQPSRACQRRASSSSSLVFESPVRSGFLTPRVIDRDRDRSFEIEIGQKTGPNRYGPVFCGLLQLQDRSKPVMVQTGPKPV